MVAIAKRVCGFGIVLFCAAWALAAESAIAADFQDQLESAQPAPQPIAPIAQPGQPPAGGNPIGPPIQSNGTVVTDETECIDLPICSPPGRFWMRADYLMWWTSGMRLPPLVTTSPQGTAQTDAGVLGNPSTSILFGGQTVNGEGRSGYRTTVGMWLDVCHVWDVEFDYVNLGEQDRGFHSGFSTGNPILARPFFNVQTNAQSSLLVAYPNVSSGSIDVDTKDYFQSAGALVSYNLCNNNWGCNPYEVSEGNVAGACGVPMLYCCRTDLLMGFRYYNLSDRVGIHQNTLMPVPGDVPASATLDAYDEFRGRNDFYGAELGLRTQIHRGRWSLDILTRLAMGNNHEVTSIGGSTITTAAGQAQTYQAGVLALGTNSGTFRRDEFEIIPQLGLELGCQLSCHWRAYVGYDVLYWGSVVRGGDQIDLNIDPRNIPPAQAGALPFPQFPGRTTSFWAQGVNVGTEFRF